MKHFKDLVKYAEPRDTVSNTAGDTYDFSKMYDEINDKMRIFRRDLKKKLTMSELELADIILNS